MGPPISLAPGAILDRMAHLSESIRQAPICALPGHGCFTSLEAVATLALLALAFLLYFLTNQEHNPGRLRNGLVGQIVLVPPQNRAGCNNHSYECGFVDGFVTLLSDSESHHNCALLQHGQVREVSIEDLHMHGALVDGHLDGFF
jgi:hypothetical protein